MDKKELQKQLLGIERQRKINEAEDRFNQHGLMGKFLNEKGLIEAEYSTRLQAIDNDIELNLETSIQQSKISEELPQLYQNKGKHKPYYKLEQIFRNKSFQTYQKIASEIGIIKSLKKYEKADKIQILQMKRTFNKRSKLKWKKKLEATKDKFNDGLVLVSIN